MRNCFIRSLLKMILNGSGNGAHHGTEDIHDGRRLPTVLDYLFNGLNTTWPLFLVCFISRIL